MVLVVVLIAVGVSKVPQWLGLKKTGETTEVGGLVKKTTTKTPAKSTTVTPSPTAVKPPTQYLPNVSDSAIPYGFKREQLSPYFGKVNISYVSQPSLYWRTFSEINLYTSLSSEEKLNITGWIIKSQKDQLEIPKGIEIYNPSISQAPQDIILKSGDSLSIYSNVSKLGINFKPNKCTGYLEKIFDLTPDLSLDCPRYSRQEISYLNAKCQDYIMSLGTCEVPDLNKVSTDMECQTILRNLTYVPCLNQHRGDSYFVSQKWLIWIGTSAGRDLNILNLVHDQLLLFDKSGLLVDEYSY